LRRKVICLPDALRLQQTLSEPITLLSAHDIEQQPDLIPLIQSFRARGGAVFIDSGGYEAARIGKYVSGYSDRWDKDAFKSALQMTEYDLAASYDIFISDDQSAVDFGIELVDCFHHDLTFIQTDKLVPVVHLQNKSGTRELNETEAIEIIDRVTAELAPPFIAVPERELGAGLKAKASLAKKIVAQLNKRGGKTKLHVLGCGNPLSFAILAGSGIGMADGLEWCRTLVGPNFHLHHFQQLDVFAEPENVVNNSAAELIRDMAGAPYLTKVMARNLHAMQGFTSLLATAIKEDSVAEFVGKNFGPAAVAALA
jgi:hypothetical protein